jgi:hypothetical protein
VISFAYSGITPFLFFMLNFYFLIMTYFKTLILLVITAFSCLPAAQAQIKPAVPYSNDILKERTFQYFWKLADPIYGQIPDRYPSLTFSSIAATGFGLTSYIVGVENKYITRTEAAARTLKTLKALYQLKQGMEPSGVSGYKGFFYHFLTLDKAERFKKVELSTIDTGLLMAGVLAVMSYFEGPGKTEREIRKLADKLYRRVDWQWAMNQNAHMSMGWYPETGFINATWQGYNEAMILLVMAMGSPTHPISEQSWEKWCETYRWDSFEGFDFVNFEPLFGHQYSHIYIDFKDIKDPYMQSKGIDYAENSRRATLANQAYCIRNPKQFIGYSALEWGLTACDGPAYDKKYWKGNEIEFQEYLARGAAATRIVDDGTIAPTAAGGSVPYAPEICIPTLAHLWNTYHDELLGEFGFKDAFNRTYTFNPKYPNGWFDIDYLGIDQGPILLQMENYQSGLIWKVMKKNPYIKKGLLKAGFTGGWLQ